jgi:hypothetical protein
MDLAGAFLGVVLGGIVTLLITICVERLRRPQLALSIEGPLDFAPRGPIPRWRSLRVRVSNEPLAPWANWWMLRSAAQQCRGEIAFLRPDGTDLFVKPMIGRWASSPEPLVAHLPTDDGTAAVLTNPAALKSTVDVYPSEAEVLDVAVKFGEEEDCYGWNDETYFFADWRNPNWRLGHGIYLVEVTVRSSGKKCRDYSRLCNDGGSRVFRLDKPTPTEWQAVTARS